MFHHETMINSTYYYCFDYCYYSGDKNILHWLLHFLLRLNGLDSTFHITNFTVSITDLDNLYFPPSSIGHCMTFLFCNCTWSKNLEGRNGLIYSARQNHWGLLTNLVWNRHECDYQQNIKCCSMMWQLSEVIFAHIKVYINYTSL